MIFENILVQKTAALAQITINRPKKLNALNKATIYELHKAFDLLESDLNIKAIILTGSGEKAFVAEQTFLNLPISLQKRVLL